MKKNKRSTIIWKGPAGEIKLNSNKSLIELFDHKSLSKYFSIEEIASVKEKILHAVKNLRKLYRSYRLTSLYHNYSHNYSTTITAFRAFIGALEKGETLSSGDLQYLLIVSLFHDTGYLKSASSQEEITLASHSKRSRKFLKEALGKLKLKSKEIESLVRFHEFTDYGQWVDYEKEMKDNLLAQIFVGADLMQVTDMYYLRNLKNLGKTKYLTKSDKRGQLEFCQFVKCATQYIWPYLDTFYQQRKKNPYREGWNSFERYIKNLKK